MSDLPLHVCNVKFIISPKRACFYEYASVSGTVKWSEGVHSCKEMTVFDLPLPPVALFKICAVSAASAGYLVGHHLKERASF